MSEFNAREFGRLYRSLSDADKRAFIAELPEEEAYAIEQLWEVRAREKQLVPDDDDWQYCLFMAGRGWGKTDSIVQWAHAQAMSHPTEVGLMVATTAADVRDVLLEGESGILKKTPSYERPHYSPTKASLTWPNGARALLRSADKPDGLRGLNSYWAICDEISSWRRPDSLNQVLFGLRLGEHPRMVLATTPKPVKHLRDFIKRQHLVIRTGSSYENRANLSPDWFNEIITTYEGTTLGQQEIEGILLDDKFGALWTSEMLEGLRVSSAPDLIRIVVGVDPAVTSGKESNETGIIVVGLAENGHVYVLDDLTVKGTPETWASAVVRAYEDYQADRIVAEINNGGDLVSYTIRSVNADVPVTQVRASRGKQTRAEPIVALYEQGRVHHVGILPFLETQQVEWVQGAFSPDRIDALVWAISDLVFGDKEESIPMRQGRAVFGSSRR